MRIQDGEQGAVHKQTEEEVRARAWLEITGATTQGLSVGLSFPTCEPKDLLVCLGAVFPLPQDKI